MTTLKDTQTCYIASLSSSDCSAPHVVDHNTCYPYLANAPIDRSSGVTTYGSIIPATVLLQKEPWS